MHDKGISKAVSCVIPNEAAFFRALLLYNTNAGICKGRFDGGRAGLYPYGIPTSQKAGQFSLLHQ